jgi:predicted nucleic acid-binding protein
VILVDTSIWIDHLRHGDNKLGGLLEAMQVIAHPFVVGEMACGNLVNRAEVLRLLGDLPAATVATDPEVLYFIDRHRLMGRGIGYVDAHLLAAVSLTARAYLWTRDRRLAAVAGELDLAYAVW